MYKSEDLHDKMGVKYFSVNPSCWVGENKRDIIGHVFSLDFDAINIHMLQTYTK